MAYSKKSSQIGVVLAVVLAVFCFSSTVRAEGSAVPGRSVGHVFLGMDRADVWKILGKPGHAATVPHGMSLYGEDTWTGNGHALTVVSERDKVMQIEFDSPRITTTDGLSTKSTRAQIRRLHPSMTVSGYTLTHFREDRDRYTPGIDAYYLDDRRRGMAFIFETEEGVVLDSLNDTIDAIIIHRPGDRVLPIHRDYWLAPEAAKENPNSLRLLRSWFTPRSTGVRAPANSQTPPQSPLPVADFEQAPHRILPGQGVDGVSLGTSRADVWKQMGKPSSTEVVPHGTHIYTADLWVYDNTTVTITFEQDKVVQIGFDSPHLTTADGLSTRSTLAQIRRRYPSLTVRGYTVLMPGTVEKSGVSSHRLDDGTGANGYWLDDVPRGIAFTIQTQDAAAPGWLDRSPIPFVPNKIVIHRPSHAVIPIVEGGWAELDQPADDPDSLRLLRSWFTPRKR